MNIGNGSLNIVNVDLNGQRQLPNVMLPAGGNAPPYNANSVSNNSNLPKLSSNSSQNNSAANFINQQINDKNTEAKQLSAQIKKTLNPSPLLPTAFLYKWSGSDSGVILDIIDFKTGKVIGSVPPSQALKYIKDYQKGMLYHKKL
ncbi:MAG: hypothetical protein EVJ47_07435 [Candidatus Acidulodesulfobacterium ferriphilum]|jgi:uncharacterized FlaG/YvyC family protein|uniref:Flagellar protein FlaG n=1 Tax=Candidatus Acidulodesulfobacterium ferriphilum TaxID=2597223 RepID=A0A519B9U9_9DELT|nr:MAG: hypothetical protein EVJ47_07435 [Candidatus Acidulodesulfobacterium ferriphilum]